MRKRTWLIGVLVVLAMVCCVNAFAAEGSNPSWEGFWNGVGGFLNNALPWNWGNWMNKS